MSQVAPTLDVRADFPVLAEGPGAGERGLAYLDSAATSQKPTAVIEAMSNFNRRSYGTVHRSVYALAEASTELFEGARTRTAELVSWDPETTIFTGNATASINLVAYTWGRRNIGPGDEILLTQMEHHSNIVPWQMLAQEKGATIRWLHVSEDGRLSLDELEEVLAQGRVKLVSVVHVSNVLGTINPVAQIAARARAAGAACLVDGSQAVPQMPVDLHEVGADFYVWTAHKALGPTGLGLLHGRRELLEAMPPFFGGGHMISQVGLDSSTYAELPGKFEAGTSAITEVVGLGAAVDYLSAIGMEAVRAHESDLTAYALERLPELEGLRVFGPTDAESRGGVISFELEGIHPHDLAEICDRSGVCIRAGHHCAQPLMRELGVSATARASFHVYNDREDVDRLVDSLGDARKVFGL
ncbi:MAG: SufS family cysteine desulfurase [Thermoleophilaceae bacterium]